MNTFRESNREGFTSIIESIFPKSKGMVDDELITISEEVTQLFCTSRNDKEAFGSPLVQNLHKLHPIFDKCPVEDKEDQLIKDMSMTTFLAWSVMACTMDNLPVFGEVEKSVEEDKEGKSDLIKYITENLIGNPEDYPKEVRRGILIALGGATKASFYAKIRLGLLKAGSDMPDSVAHSIASKIAETQFKNMFEATLKLLKDDEGTAEAP